MLPFILRANLIYPFGTSIFSLTCFLDENNQIPVSTEDMTPGVVSSIISTEAIQADLLQAGEGRKRFEEVPEDFPPHENDREDYEDRENNHEGLEDNHEDRDSIREDTENNQMFDSYSQKQNSENESIPIDSSKEGIYKILYGAQDDLEESPDDLEEPVISDSSADEGYNDYPIDRNSEVHDQPFVAIVEPEDNDEEQRRHQE